MRIGPGAYSCITRRFGANTERLGKTIRKLSSGLRIDCAADDAAGMAISEKIDSQLNGYITALKSALDAISYVQVADGALNEVHDILHRMREIAVQASNGINTDIDRKHLDEEYQRLKENIKGIFTRTEFNTKKVFTLNLTEVGDIGGSSRIVKWKKTSADITGSSSSLVSVSSLKVASDGDILVGITSYLPGGDSYLMKYSPDGSLVYKVSSSENIYAIEEDSSGNVVVGGDGWIGVYDGNNINTLSASLPFEIHSIQVLSNGNYVVSGTDSTAGVAIVAIIDKNGNVVNSTSVTGAYSPSVKITSDNKIVVLSYSNSNTYITKLDMNLNEEWEVNVSNGDEGLYGGVFYSGEVWETSSGTFVTVNSDTNVIRVIKTDGSTTETYDIAPERFTYNEPHTVSIYPSDDGGYIVSAGALDQASNERFWVATLDKDMNITWEGFVGDGGDHPKKVIQLPSGDIVVGGLSYNYTLVDFNPSGIVYTEEENYKYMVVQLSPNEGGNMVISYKGFEGLLDLMSSDVLTYDHAQDALVLIDEAVNYINDIRTKLGAYMNRLEKSVNSLMDAIVNLTSAESVIKDSDIVGDYVRYTKELIKVNATIDELVAVKSNMEMILRLFE